VIRDPGRADVVHAIAQHDLRPAQRAPLLVLGFVGLVAGVGAGLARLGYPMPTFAAQASAWHGALMIGAFFGVVIALERAVAIGRPWAYAAPFAGGAGGVAIIAGSVLPGAWLLFAASAVLLAASLDVVRRQRAPFTITLAIGALCWAVGNARFALGALVHGVVTWWLAFLILTIAGERLELSRFVQTPAHARRAFVALVAIMLGALVAGTGAVATRVFGVALVALAAWLFRHDVARRTVRKPGLTRFIAVCLLGGYAWLALGGATLAVAGLDPALRSYDAIVHALALGFVFSMVFGHAPIIRPAVLRVSIPHTRWFYVPLVLLHGSLALRVAGDASTRFEWIRVGGLLNALALAAVVVANATIVVRARTARTAQRRVG
jgi:hypothetical protein